MPTPRTAIRNVGRRIAELRINKGRTQAQVAEDLGFSVKYQQLVESGTENLTLESLVRFANYFGIEPGEMLRPPSLPRQRRGRPRTR